MDSIISTTSEDVSSIQESKLRSDVDHNHDHLLNDYKDSAPSTKMITTIDQKLTIESEMLEKKVEELANDYMQDLQLLLKKQEQERTNLRLQFERKQKELVEQILQQFPNLSTDKENVSPDREQNNDEPMTSIPLAESFPNAESQNIDIPEDAYLPKYAQGWARLTALARGFLVRRLIKTDKVQDLKRTIRDTVVCAVKLHKDTGTYFLQTQSAEL